MHIHDAYTILRVRRDATLKDIKIAFRRLSLTRHPDKPGGTNEDFQNLKDAYELLSSLHKHEEQNHTRPEPPDPPPPPRAPPHYPHPYMFSSMFKSSEKDIREQKETLKMYQQAASEMNDENGPLYYEYGPVKNKRGPNHNMLCACNKWLRYDILGSHRLKCKLVDRTAVYIIATGTISEDAKKIVHPRGEMWLSDIKRAIPHLPQPI